MKDMGKYYSRKLRYDIYYTLYRMDPKKTHYKISFSANISNIENLEKCRIYSPLLAPLKALPVPLLRQAPQLDAPAKAGAGVYTYIYIA